MSSLVETAARLFTRSGDLDARLTGLEQAVAASRGRLDEGVVDEAAAVAERARARLRLSADHTVVALAGSTGSGTSSTFNALAGLELSAVGVRRPTTSWTTACVWGPDDADDLLGWLDIPPRHRVARDSMLDTGREDRSLDGAVLLDLPDHDSTVVSHHVEVDRLVRLADLLVWVLDPQKYADAAVHRRYLTPLAGHAEVVVVVLNRLDTVAPQARESMLADLRRLLEADGLTGVPLIGMSAREGWGIDELRGEIARRVAAKRSSRARVEADLRRAADELAGISGDAPAEGLPRQRVAELHDAVAAAAGVPTVVAAVEAASRVRANRATGWPLVSWVGRLKPDPLRRLHLDLRPEHTELAGVSRTSVPAPTLVERARVDAAVRGVAADLGTGLARPWAVAVRGASVGRADELADRLDTVVAGTDLGVARIPAWARLVRVLQWLLLVSAVVGAAWLGVLAVMGYLRLPEPVTPEVRGVPVPTGLLLGGVLAGVLLALLCRVLVRWSSRRRARAAERRLRRAVAEVCEELVVAPVEAELAAYRSVRDGLAAARR